MIQANGVPYTIKVCPKCCVDMVMDYKHGEWYCPKCGLVVSGVIELGYEHRMLENDDFRKARIGGKLDFTRPDKGLTTTFRGGGRKKWLNEITAVPDKKYQYTIYKLGRVAAQLNLTSFTPEACLIYKQIRKKRPFQGKDVDYLAVAILNLLASKYEIFLNPIAVACRYNLDRKKYLRIYYKLRSLYRLPPQLPPGSYINAIARECKTENIQRISTRACEICDMVKDHPININRSMKSLAAAAFIVACEDIGERPKISQIQKILGVSQASLKNRADEIKGILRGEL